MSFENQINCTEHRIPRTYLSVEVFFAGTIPTESLRRSEGGVARVSKREAVV